MRSKSPPPNGNTTCGTRGANEVAPLDIAWNGRFKYCTDYYLKRSGTRRAAQFNVCKKLFRKFSWSFMIGNWSCQKLLLRLLFYFIFVLSSVLEDADSWLHSSSLLKQKRSISKIWRESLSLSCQERELWKCGGGWDPSSGQFCRAPAAHDNDTIDRGGHFKQCFWQKPIKGIEVMSFKLLVQNRAEDTAFPPAKLLLHKNRTTFLRGFLYGEKVPSCQVMAKGTNF